MRAPKPLAAFYIRPDKRSRLSVLVEVYPTIAAFRTAERVEAQQNGRRYRTRGLIGSCAGVTVRNNGRKAGVFANLRFPRQHLTMSTITHEAFHATMRWAERQRITSIPTIGAARSNMTWPSVSTVEERCAGFHDSLCRRIVWECDRRGLFPTGVTI
jgi:hypothetical protein